MIRSAGACSRSKRLQVQQLVAASAAPVRDQLSFESAWRLASSVPAELPADPGRWLILTDASGVGAALREQLERAGGHAECAYLDGGALTEATCVRSRVGRTVKLPLCRAPSPHCVASILVALFFVTANWFIARALGLAAVLVLTIRVPLEEALCKRASASTTPAMRPTQAANGRASAAIPMQRVPREPAEPRRMRC